MSTLGYERRRGVYEALPGVLREPIRWVPFRMLAGRAYRATMARQRAMDGASRQEILAYQERQLGATLSRAVETVPAYRRFRSITQRLSPFEALKAFPPLTKAELQSNIRNYLPSDFDLIPHVSSTTGGTSGEQCTFFVDDNSQAVETAFMHRQWARVGYTPRCRKATFRGVAFTRLRPGEYWQANPIYNELQFSPFHLSSATLPLYSSALQGYRPSFIHGYPSAIYTLARYVLSATGRPTGDLNIKAVLLGSEGVEGAQRETIEAAFHCRVYTWYGHSERVILAGECEHDVAYHNFPDYGVLEVVAGDQEHPEIVGGRGELVGTGLLNRSMPLIRYRTGDFATLLEPRCKCGRHFDRFGSVEGRWAQEFVIGRSGSRMSLAALNVHGDVFRNVSRYQYFQDSPGVLKIHLVPMDGLSADDMKAIQEAYTRKIGDELSIETVIVPSMSLTPRGKMKRLIQTIAPDRLALLAGEPPLSERPPAAVQPSTNSASR